MDPPEPVNLNRAILLCNLYNFFFAASKACLFPFFSLYLRLLGLTATQTGVIISLKTLVAFIFAPLWTKCAVQCRKRRLVFTFSIFMMAVTYLSLTLVPNQNHAALSQCVPAYRQTSQNQSKFQSTAEILTILNHNESRVSPQEVTQTDHNNTSDEHLNNKSSVTPTSIQISSQKPTETLTDDLEDKKIEISKEILMYLGLKQEEVQQMNKQDIYEVFNEMMTTEDMRGLVENKLDAETVKFVWKVIDESRPRGKADKSSDSKVRRKRDINITSLLASLKTGLHDLRQRVKDSSHDYTFVVVTIILLIGELFACPVEKLADDFWFDYLEKIDELEKYGKHRIWCSLAYMSFPLIVTLVVSKTDCLFGMNMPPFMLHFYVFGSLLGLTFLLGFFFPISADAKAKYKSKLRRGLGTTCCKCVGLLYVFTLLLVGMIYAAYYNFLFWMIQDLNGPESVMGLCITISTLVEIPMLFFSKEIIQRLGHGGVASLSLLMLSGRTLYYSFLWTPWAVLPAEMLHALTHTALWYAVFNNPSFNINPMADRSIRSILSSIYFGLGFASGSIASGLIYDSYGSEILYIVCSVAAIIWCPVFFVLQKCCQPPAESEIKYTRLLQSEDLSDDEIPDDWLEKALKDR
ncbi:major facilitator superfamily domain-containing protein 6-like protein B [Mizuhopecten yessoensis]|uniref:Major facilitator superfamily domain-containing protein 6-like protein B n=1 Tax=Mizuhopecten yessoensis TaxID=6573 RepID=A0A210QG62_MIZYE|nr:major facilitator superfamily domain-containing protein 6-like protein B [Mizuhopecten yessoensis]OWF47611.1 Major facilitator superfamily domain-containing protein 6-like protein B [Mizuhopecten yessoensis]